MRNYNIQPRGPGVTPSPPMSAFMSSARAAMAHLGSPTGNPGEGRLMHLNARLGDIASQAAMEGSLLQSRLGAQHAGVAVEGAAGQDSLSFQDQMSHAGLAWDRERWEHEHGEGNWFDKLLKRVATVDMLGESFGDAARGLQRDPAEVAKELDIDATPEEIEQASWGGGVGGTVGRGLDWLNRQLGRVFPGLKKGTKEHAENYARQVRISQRNASMEDLDSQLSTRMDELASLTKQLGETQKMAERFSDREPFGPWLDGADKVTWNGLVDAQAATAEAYHHHNFLEQEMINAIPELTWPDEWFDIESDRDQAYLANRQDLRKRARSFADRALEAW